MRSEAFGCGSSSRTSQPDSRTLFCQPWVRQTDADPGEDAASLVERLISKSKNPGRALIWRVTHEVADAGYLNRVEQDRTIVHVSRAVGRLHTSPFRSATRI